jgi:hypothetical protein
MKRKKKSRPVDEQKEREAKSALGDRRVLVAGFIGVKGGDPIKDSAGIDAVYPSRVLVQDMFPLWRSTAITI